MEPFKFLVLTGWHEHIAIAICVLAIFIIPMCIKAISDAMAESRAEKERQEHYHRFYYVDCRITYELYGFDWMNMLVDKETRVQYIMNLDGKTAPWIDENGKPIKAV